MKFITENDLRMLYQQAPFSQYPYQEGQRLTPGGRQFLLDRGVKIEELPIDNTKRKRSNNQVFLLENKLTIAEAEINSEMNRNVDLDVKTKLALQTIAANFLQIGVDLLTIDVLIAQEVFALEQYLMKLVNGVKADEQKEVLGNSQSCTGLNSENFNQDIGSCFDINGFHAQTEKGREIVKLHYLRCLLQEQQPGLPKYYQEAINGLINRLSQMICQALGGVICQRKQ